MNTAGLIAETRGFLLGGIREQKNKLSATVTSGAGSMAFTYTLGSIAAGAVITIGLERMYVWDTTTTTATVERGWDNTTAAAHTAGDIVSVNSRCDDFTVLAALNHELDALSAPTNGLFNPVAVELTYNAATFGYDITDSATMLGSPIRVDAKYPGLRGMWQPLNASDWRYEPNANVTDFPSGNALFLTNGSPGYAVRVIYRAPFGNLTSLTADVQTSTDFPATANDILPMGAALRLGSAHPMRRSDTESQTTRRPEDVTTQDTLIAVSGIDKKREARIREEAARLDQVYGI